jgi:anaerobic magnesium-protoporphyrin IX monomethyl ester cyclase
VRIDTLDAELLRAMKQSGCYSLSLGIESGCDPVLKSIQKKIDSAHVREQVELIHRIGLKTTGFFIIGFPGESEAQIRQTVRFARSLPLDHAQFSTFLPLPGTLHFDEYVAKVGWGAIPWKNFYTTDPVQWPGGIPIARLRTLQRRAFSSFYFRPRIVLGILRQLRGPRHFWHLLQRALKIFKPLRIEPL